MALLIKDKDWIPADNINLTEEQKNVVNNVVDNLAVIAGPGTGKTEVLAQKATYLLQTGACSSPYRILALTYKVEAAVNIRSRVRKRCPTDFAYRFHSLTMDSFLISIVRRFSKCLPSWLNIDRNFHIVDCIDSVDYLRSTGFKDYPKEYKEYNALEKSAENIKHIYLYAMNINSFDYDMCRAMAFYILKNNCKIRELISKTYMYIFLDEFQDLITSHYEIIKLLFCNEYNKITAVGDFNQAIMGWAGAVPDIFKDFKQDFQAKEYLFKYNHRSSSKIVNFINIVVQRLVVPGQIPIVYQGVEKDNDNNFISAVPLIGPLKEYVYIAKCIKQFIKGNPNLVLGDFAIILKQKADDYLTKSQEIFAKYNIKLRNEDAKVCSNGIKIQELMVDPLSKISIFFLKIHYHKLKPYEQKELDYLVANTLGLDLSKDRDIKKLYDIKRQMLAEQFVDMTEWLSNIYRFLPEAKICSRLYNNKNELVRAQKSIVELFNHSLIDTNADVVSAIDNYLGINSVRLMTTHKSKGLEFDTVFFADFHQDSWWTLNKLNKREKDEALRCFFVGLSRAKNRLLFTTPSRWPDDIKSILDSSNNITKYNPDNVSA